ncbi:MAG: phosphatidylserine decarboxylase [Gammaproteobacteria bacterium]|nr:phosphatidylserine decarboxylase [Gammaproteobacteria bacterium]
MNTSGETGGRWFAALQCLLPQHLLSRLVGALARTRLAWVRRPLVAGFVRAYRPELSDAVEPDPRAYPSFNAFFTRPLRAGSRPASPAPRAIDSPVDGRISALGLSSAGRLLQAKGRDYSLRALLAGNEPLCASLAGGPYMTIYLAPFNYHRIHMALAGTLRGAWYVPGRLFSVNDATARHVPGLFARNERIVLQFDSPAGTHALVMVGALFVGSMGTVWHGDIAPRRARGALALPVPTGSAASDLARGAELGRFNMGSTVILLLPPGPARWDASLECGATLRVGQTLGELGARATAATS